METTDTLNNSIITVGGIEVDTSARSVKLAPVVVTAINRVVREKGTVKAAAAYFNIGREVFTNTRSKKSCHPETYIQILNTLYPQTAA